MTLVDASTLVGRLSGAYANCQFYEDSGLVLIGGVPSGRFDTRFVRASGELVFTFVDGAMTLRLGIKGERLDTFDLPETFSARLRAPGTVTAAVATLAGITHSAGQIVPRLLSAAAVGGRSIVDVAAPSIVANGSVDDEDCAWVRLGDEFPDAFAAISTDSGALRRYVIAGGPLDPAWLSAVGRDAVWPSRLPARMIKYECSIR